MAASCITVAFSRTSRGSGAAAVGSRGGAASSRPAALDRRYIRPVARLVSLVAVWAIVALKRVLPFQFSSHSLLDWLSVRFLRHCVSREGGELLLRHFIVETVLIRFVARNCGLPDVPEPALMPTSISDCSVMP